MPVNSHHLTLLKQLISEAPSQPGVYLLYADANPQSIPLYIGKSIEIKKRLLSHCYQSAHDHKEARLLSQVNVIRWQLTAGDIGAQLLEASLIKQLLPLYNRRLRRSKRLIYFTLDERQGRQIPVAHSTLLKDFTPQADRYGLFRSAHHAKAWLIESAKSNGLCLKVLGLEPGTGACFAYQLKRCAGACVGDESLVAHQQRLFAVLNELAQTIWPHENAVLIKESCQGITDYHLIDKWCYLGTYNSEIIDLSRARKNACAFDLDHYKIFQKALLSIDKSHQIITLDEKGACDRHTFNHEC